MCAQGHDVVPPFKTQTEGEGRDCCCICFGPFEDMQEMKIKGHLGNSNDSNAPESISLRPLRSSVK